MNWQITGKTLLLQIDTRVYEKNSIMKCFYWYGGSFEVDITCGQEPFLEVRLVPLQGDLSSDRVQALVQKIRTDLLDFQTRAIIDRETAPIRELIIAKAFSPIEDYLAEPPGSVADPVGFEVEEYDHADLC